ncbi:transposase [Aliivibrio sifiae]
MSKYSRELKCTIAKQCLNGVSSRHLAKQYSISSTQISYWTQVFSIHGNQSFLPTTHASTAHTKLQALNLWTGISKLSATEISIHTFSPVRTFDKCNPF